MKNLIITALMAAASVAFAAPGHHGMPFHKHGPRPGAPIVKPIHGHHGAHVKPMPGRPGAHVKPMPGRPGAHVKPMPGRPGAHVKPMPGRPGKPHGPKPGYRHHRHHRR